MGYEKSKVYKLQHEDGHFYIGSTINELRVRFQGHKETSKRHLKQRLYAHINGEWDNVRIILIEAFECTNRNELLKKENEYIQKELDNPLCLNSKRALCSEEELAQQAREYSKKYRLEHIDEVKEYKKHQDKIYYQKNKEKIIQRQRERNLLLKTHSE